MKAGFAVKEPILLLSHNMRKIGKEWRMEYRTLIGAYMGLL